MNKQVVGFLFSPNKEQVVLILKDRPSWQKGLLNGVGGHCIENELPRNAIIRKFEEETTLIVENWQCYAVGTKTDETIEVYFYRAFSEKYKDVTTNEDEEVYIINVNDFIRNAEDFPAIYNLRWLVQLALDNKTSETHFKFN